MLPSLQAGFLMTPGQYEVVTGQEGAAIDIEEFGEVQWNRTGKPLARYQSWLGYGLPGQPGVPAAGTACRWDLGGSGGAP